MRDFQKQRVYGWEDEFVVPKINTKPKSISELSVLCSYMWDGVGQTNPPKLFIDPDYKRKSTGGRYEIRFAEHMTNEFVLVHEMAHSLNCAEHREVYDHHGPNFVADYCRLLVEFYGFDINYLLYTLKKSKVKINLGLYYKDLS